MQTVSGAVAQISANGVLTCGYDAGEYLVRASSSVQTDSWAAISIRALPRPFVAFSRAEDAVWVDVTNYNAKARLTPESLKSNINWSVEALEGIAVTITTNGVLNIQSNTVGRYRISVQPADYPTHSAAMVVNVLKLNEFSLTTYDNRCAFNGAPACDKTVYAVERPQGSARIDLNVNYSPSGATGMMWKVVSMPGINGIWFPASGFASQMPQRLDFAGWPQLTNRNYQIWVGYDANANGALEINEYKYMLNAKMMRFDRLQVADALHGVAVEDSTEEEDATTPTLYLTTDTNGCAMLSMNERLLPGTNGLKNIHPGPIAGDAGTYASMHLSWELRNMPNAGGFMGRSPLGWNKTSGCFYTNGIYSNNIVWVGGAEATNREFALWTWYDEDGDSYMAPHESRRIVYVHVLDNDVVKAAPLHFVPVNGNVTLAITAQTDVAYTLILSRERGGTNGWATFADGTTTQHVQGATNVVIRGVQLSQQLKNMRLRALADSIGGELVEPGFELFHQDFTVGQIQLMVHDDMNGSRIVPLSLAPDAPPVSVVPPGDYITLWAICSPIDLEQSLGWSVGNNQQVEGNSIEFTSAQASVLEISLTIDDPQSLPLSFLFPTLTIDAFDRVPPGMPKQVAVTMTPSPLPAGCVVSLKCDTQAGNYGSATVSPSSITRTTIVTVTGGTQSGYAERDTMKLEALLKGKVYASESFTVCAHPINFARSSNREDLKYGFVAMFYYVSDSGHTADLDKCKINETITLRHFDKESFVSSDVVVGRPLLCDGQFCDNIYCPPTNIIKPCHAGFVSHDQLYYYFCDRCVRQENIAFGPVGQQIVENFGVWSIRTTQTVISPEISLQGIE